MYALTPRGQCARSRVRIPSRGILWRATMRRVHAPTRARSLPSAIAGGGRFMGERIRSMSFLAVASSLVAASIPPSNAFEYTGPTVLPSRLYLTSAYANASRFVSRNQRQRRKRWAIQRSNGRRVR